MIDLKKCPFCGSEAELYGECDMVKVRCSNYDCQCQLVTWFDEPEEAADEWNRRDGDKQADKLDWIEGILIDDMQEYSCPKCSWKTFLPFGPPTYCEKCGWKKDGEPF